MKRRNPAKKRRSLARKIVDKVTADAVRGVREAWDRAESTQATTDGGDLDPERGPEDERLIAGERVQTFIDKVFGGRAVIVVRTDGNGILHYPLGRVSEHETRGSILGPELSRSLGVRPRSSASAVVNGVWRNDCNGFITDQITALTEDEAIEQLVIAFKKQQDSKAAGRSDQSRPPRRRSRRSFGVSDKRRLPKPVSARIQQTQKADAEHPDLRELFDKWRLGTEMVPRRDLSRYVEDLTYVLFVDLPNAEHTAAVCQYLLPLWDMIDNFGLKLNHAKIARRLERGHGVSVTKKYRNAVDLWQEKVRAGRRVASH